MDGNDGPWSTFIAGVGEPPQFANVLVSTVAEQPWFVVPLGCNPLVVNSSSCAVDRGRLYDPSQSSSWHPLGNYTAQTDNNLDPINGEYGFDTLSFGVEGQNLPNLTHQLVVGIASPDVFLATWGVHPLSTNLSSLDDPIPSWISDLKTTNLTTSLSWAYTAGSYGNSLINKQSFGSLIIGGYDASLFLPSPNITFSLAPTDERDLAVGIHSITVTGDKPLLSEPVIALLDPSISHLWLPIATCQAFADAFQLTWDSTLGLYLVNETAHADLVQRNATVSFSIANDAETSDPSVTIDLPYAAFDLTLTTEYPGISTSTRYFPIRRAANETQYTLGRVFFQHAYVIADYERRQFSVHQALFPDNPTADLWEILPPSSDSPRPAPPSGEAQAQAKIPASVIVGIAIGAATAASLVFGVLLLLYRRRRTRKTHAVVSNQKPRLELSENGAKPPAVDLDGRPVSRRGAELTAQPLSELSASEPAAMELSRGPCTSPLGSAIGGESKMTGREPVLGAVTEAEEGGRQQPAVAELPGC